MEKILVTGCAGFIGFHVAERLLAKGYSVAGLDNLSEYYDVNLKKARLAQLEGRTNFRFFKIGLEDREAMGRLFQAEGFDRVVHLAAQAGVRYSLTNPHVYVQANL